MKFQKQLFNLNDKIDEIICSNLSGNEHIILRQSCNGCKNMKGVIKFYTSKRTNIINYIESSLPMREVYDDEYTTDYYDEYDDGYDRWDEEYNNDADYNDYE